MFESETLYHTIIENSPDAIYILDDKGRIFFSNNQAAILLGLNSAKDIIGNNISNFLSPTDYHRAINNISRILNRENIGKNEYCLIKKDGSKIFGETTSSLIEIESISPAILVVARDITERKKFEEELVKDTLAKSEGRYRMLHESLRDGFVQVSMDGRIIEFNDNFCEMLGYSPEEIRGLTYQQITPERWHVYEQKIVEEQIIPHGYSDVYEKEYRRKNGTIFPVELRTMLSRDESGQPSSMWAIVRDITERKQAEEALRISERRFRTLAEAMPQMVWSADANGSFDYYNERAYEYAGVKPEDLLGRNWVSLIHPDDLERTSNAWRHCMETGELYTIEHRLRRADGEYRWHLTRGVAVRDEYGSITRWIGTITDIHDDRIVQEALKQAEQRLSAHLQNSPTAVIEFDPQFKVIRWSKEAERMFGWVQEEIIGHTISEMKWVYKDDVDMVIKASDYYANGEVPVECHVNRNYRKDGSIISCEWYNSSIYDSSGKLISVLSQVLDITERKKAEEALRESEEKFSRVFHGSPVAMTLARFDTGCWVDVNDAYTNLVGYTREEILTHSSQELKIIEHSVLQQFADKVQTKGGLNGEEVNIRRKDGEQRTVLYYNEAVVLNGIEHSIFSIVDITERKKAQESIREFEAKQKVAEALDNERKRFFEVLETLPPMVCLLTRDYQVAFANRSFREKFGESNGRHCYEFRWNQKEPCKFCESYEPLKTRKPHQWELIAGDGSIISCYDYPFTDVDGTKMILEMNFDITAQRQAEKEIKKLNEELEQRVKARTVALRDSEERFRALSETAPIGVGVSSAEGILLYTNPEYESILGYNHSELIGKKASDLYLHPDDRIQLLENMHKGYIRNFEIRLKRKDDTPVWVTINTSNIRFKGEQALIGTIQDITERKKQEQIIKESLKEKEVLLKEIHHRVKNNLQLISSLLNLQANKIQNEEAREAFMESQNRVKSMALIHEKLYQSKSLSNINIIEYINDIASKLFSSYNHYPKHINLNLKIEDINLEVDKCIAIGLIINELISNSLKHAFTDKANGEIIISSFKEDNNKLILTVSDNGKGLPQNFDYRNAETLGLQLVSALVKQHKGTMVLDSINGAKFTISLCI